MLPSAGTYFNGYDYIVDDPVTNTMVVKIFNPYWEGDYNANSRAYDQSHAGSALAPSDSNNYAALVHLLTKETPPEHRAPGSYMYEALKYRDQWESRLLRRQSA